MKISSIHMLAVAIIMIITASMLQAQADLEVRNVNLYRHNTPYYHSGQFVEISYLLTNHYGPEYESIYYEFSLLTMAGDPSTALTTNTGFGGTTPAPGESATRFAFVNILYADLGEVTGDYYLYFKMWPGTSTDDNPGNNILTKVIKVSIAPLSDGADMELTWMGDNSDEYVMGGWIIVSYEFSNISLYKLYDCNIKLFLSKDTNITEDDYYLGTRTFGTHGYVDALNNYTSGISEHIPDTVPHGKYYLGIIGFASNDINPSNNVMYNPIPFQYGDDTGGGEDETSGSVAVQFSPNAIQNLAAWRRVGTEIWFGHMQFETDLEPGDYELEFREVEGYRTPANRTAVVKSDEQTMLNVAYKRAPRLPLIEAFESLPGTIYPGEPARILWKVMNVDSVNILPVLGLRTGAGSFPIDMPESTIFNLSASNNDGTASESTKFRIINNRKIVLFTSNSSEDNPLNTSETVRLYWYARGFSELFFDTNEDGTKDASTKKPFGVIELSLDSSRFVRLMGQGENGNASAETNVYMTNLPVVRSFEISPRVVLAGEKATLHWKVPGMQSAVIEPFGISVDDEEGTYRFAASKNMKIRIRAVNQYGSVEKSRKLRVAEKGTDLVLNVKNDIQRKNGKQIIPFKNSPIFTANVTVTNTGLLKARRFLVSMYANNELVDQTRVKSALRPGHSVDLQLNYLSGDIYTIPIRIEVDPEGTVPDVNRGNNVRKFGLIVYPPEETHVWISNVGIQHIGMEEGENVVMLNFRVSQLGGKGRTMYFYRAQFFDMKKDSGETEVARVEGFLENNLTIRKQEDVMRLLRLDDDALDGRVEISVVNVNNTNGFIDLNSFRTFNIRELGLGDGR